MYSTTKMRLALNCTACRRRRISGWPASWEQKALMRSHHDNYRQGRCVVMVSIDCGRPAMVTRPGPDLTLHVSEMPT